MKFVTIFLACCLASCGSMKSASHLSAVANNSLFVVMGGRSSCEEGRSPFYSGVNQRFGSLAADLRDNGIEDTHKVTTCFSSGGRTVYFHRSDDPDYIYSIGAASFAGELLRMVDGLAIEEAHLIGHSYGGWLGIESAHQLADAGKLGHLVTIDPISQPHCRISNPAACTQFPPDFYRHQLEAIREEATGWLNFYQQQSSLVHSGATPYANNYIVYADHNDIDEDYGVWRMVASSFLPESESPDL